MDTKEPEALEPLHYSPVNVNGGVLGPPFPVVQDRLLCLAYVDGEVVVLAPHCQASDLLPIGQDSPTGSLRVVLFIYYSLLDIKD